MFFFIYKTVNKTNGKYYIGKHQTNDLNDGYIGSGPILKRAIKKYGIENFDRQIICYCSDVDDLNQKEKYFVDENVVKDKMSYNLKIGGDGGFDYLNNAYLTYDKRSKRSIKIWKAIKKDPEKMLNFRKRITAGLKRYLKENGCWWTGKKHTEETKRKISEKNKKNNIGSKNPNYGKRWWKDPIDQTKCKMFGPDEIVPDGWIRGKWPSEKERYYKNTHKKIVITDGHVRKVIDVLKDNVIVPVGWSAIENPIKIKRTVKTKKKHSNKRILNVEKTKENVLAWYRFYRENGYESTKRRFMLNYPVDYFIKKVKKYIPDAIFNKSDLVNSRIWVSRDGKAKYVVKENIDFYLSNGWKIGRLHGSWK